MGSSMAIEPKCDKCGKELKKFGGILLSPPDKAGMVKKNHLCQGCYKEISRGLDKKYKQYHKSKDGL